jgi:hypothetical protein
MEEPDILQAVEERIGDDKEVRYVAEVVADDESGCED